MPGEDGYMLASSATELEIRIQRKPERQIAITTQMVVVISNKPDIMVNELVPNAMPAPNET